MAATRHTRSSSGGAGSGRAIVDRASAVPPAPVAALAVVLVLVLALAGCSGEAAPQVDPADRSSPGDMTDVSHSLEPTAQMQQAAEQQCLDDPELAQGYVKAVAPETGGTLAELTVECEAVRAGG